MKTRTVRHQDGRLEIIRLLDQENLAEFTPGDPLSQEASIVWLPDARKSPYVRVMLVPTCKSRRGPLNVTGGGRVVGSSTLLPDAPADRETGRFTRRVFYLRDADFEPPSGEPIVLRSAVDPKTVLPGEKGSPVTSAKPTSEPADVSDTDSGQYIVTLRGSSVVLDWVADENLAHVLADDEHRSAATETSLDLGRINGELVPVEGGAPIPLRGKRLRAGRLGDCDIVLRFDSVSALHCELSVHDGYFYVRDLNSTNGTQVNGERVDPGTRIRLDPRAILAIARHSFEVRYDPAQLGALHVPPEELED